MTTPVWIGLGSNLGDRKGILDAAIAALAETPGVTVEAVSCYHETIPVGGPPGQGPFLNAAARLSTSLDPHQLLSALQEIENQAGRVRTVRWGERTLDLDILIFGTRFLDEKQLKLPHPRLALRRFVIEPLAEIAPRIVDTITKRTIADLLANLDREPRFVALHGPDDSRKAAVFHQLEERLPGIGILAADLGRSEVRADDFYSEDFHASVRKFEALRADRWEAESRGLSWIVTDFFLRLNLMKTSPRALLSASTEFRTREGLRAYHQGVELLRDAEEAALTPTLAVMLPGCQEISRRPGLTNVPRLWPESEKPDAIVAEVLATCRAIQGV
ncbi:2-amino-4-hydroxy-6-hydroxymethyldihydropteridine diphosphokinase [Tundrisphaera lichenicola]|uniref:2-amino-4-hydroxy-6- hydroxymethyldihydropteridine diphosphokinase n=1 Tax=Tundrisphaera lichenicola TaxID=2029860 RepID=UPI003EB94D45